MPRHTSQIWQRRRDPDDALTISNLQHLTPFVANKTLPWDSYASRPRRFAPPGRVTAALLEIPTGRVSPGRSSPVEIEQAYEEGFVVTVVAPQPWSPAGFVAPLKPPNPRNGWKRRAILMV